MSDQHDVCIVGSGAGGGAVAYALTAAGYRTVVLEKGPHLRTGDFYHDEVAVCRRDMFVPAVHREPNVVAADGGPALPSREGWTASCVGGGTAIMSGFFFRMHEADFRLRSRVGAIAGADHADWPFDYAALARYYDQVERFVGVSGATDANPSSPKRGPYPQPPLTHHPAAALIERTSAELGLHAFPTPRAILSRPREGRGACNQCGFCGSYGCETGAKSSSLVTFLPAAQKTGRLTLLPGHTAIRIITDARGHAQGVISVGPGGAQHRHRARVVVLAASAIQSTRLLLVSELANQSGLLGRNLMFSTVSQGWGRFPRDHAGFAHSPLPFVDRALQERGRWGAGDGTSLDAGTILFHRPHPNPIFQTERLARLDGPTPVFGDQLQRRMREFFLDTYTLELETFSEFLPHGGCRVSLDDRFADYHGVPAARIDASVHPASLDLSDRLAAMATEILTAAGATRTGMFDEARSYYLLQCGTARMGDDPTRSVLDATCQAHDVKNLYVADGSSFPSSGGAPFTMTIMANALRVSDHIKERGARGEL